jgi:hypothetical protein
MATIMVRLRPDACRALKEISESTGQSVQDTLDRAIDDLRRKVYLEGLNADYAALRHDSKAWSGFRREVEDWDSTDADGLEDS